MFSHNDKVHLDRSRLRFLSSSCWHLCIPILLSTLSVLVSWALIMPAAAAATTTNWPMSGFNPANTKLNPNETILNTSTVSQLKLAWEQNNKSDGFTRTNSQEVVDGFVYVVDGSGNVIAYNELSGKIKWSKFVPDAFASVSVTVENGLVYVGGGDAANNHGALYALNATNGKTVWESMLPTDNSFEIQTSPTYADRMIFGTWDDGYLRAFDATTGKQLWNQLTTSNYSSAAVANGLVYVGSDAFDGSQYLYAFHEKTGKLAWKTETLNDARIGSAPAVANGIVYVNDIENKQLHAYTATNGTLLWSFSVLEGSAQNSPAIANGTVYITSPDDSIYALNAKTGTLRWSYATGGEIDASATVANGVVYLGSQDNTIYALNAASGQKLWSYSIPSGPSNNNDGLNASSPTVVNGMVFVASEQNLFAFQS